MQRAVVVAVLAAFAAVSFVACGDERSTDSSSSEEARTVAVEATEAVADLESRIDDLVADLDRVEAARQSFADKFDRIHKDLRDSIANLRASLSDATSDASSARDAANRALAELDSAMERLSVLENRFDYHVRNHD